MLTKMLTAVVMTGALWVAGDAAYQKFDCGSTGYDCCPPATEGCFGASKASDCCSSGSECWNEPSECCVGMKNTPPPKSCCESQK